MYLKKVEGPRAVTLPDGSIMTRADLPPSTTVRWVASRKQAVVQGVRHGLISAEMAMGQYGISEEELANWDENCTAHGAAGLRATVRYIKQS